MTCTHGLGPNYEDNCTECMNENKSTPDIHTALKEVDRQVGRAVERLGDTPSVEPKGWEEVYVTRYSPRFRAIATYADDGNDKAYGRELAALETDIVSFISSLLSSQRKELMEQIRGMVPEEKEANWVVLDSKMTHSGMAAHCKEQADKNAYFNACRTEMFRSLDEIKEKV